METANALKDGFGCGVALNLDGGPSTGWASREMAARGGRSMGVATRTADHVWDASYVTSPPSGILFSDDGDRPIQFTDTSARFYDTLYVQRGATRARKPTR